MATDITYRDVGSGAPIVLVHAGIADGRMWEPQIEALSNYRVVVPDLRGFGSTPLPDRPFSMVDDLVALCSSLDIENAVWIGCSMGATTVLDLALAHPHLVRAMVLSNCVPSGFQITDPVTIEGWTAAGQAFDRGDLEMAAKIEMEMWLVGPSRQNDAVPANLRKLVVDMVRASYDHGEGEHTDPPRLAIDHLEEVARPTMVIAGGHDQAQFRVAAELLASRIEGAIFRTVGDAAHLPSLERPDEFNQMVVPFVDQAPE